MASISLKFPVFVSRFEENRIKKFKVNPIFSTGFYADHVHFDKANRKLQKLINGHFKSYDLNRASLNDIQWFRFNPETDLELLNLDFNLGGKYIKGAFPIVLFKVKQKLFVNFPTFHGHIFLVRPDKAGTFEGYRKQASAKIKTLLSGEWTRNPNYFEPEQYMSQKGDFINEFQTSVSYKSKEFAFEVEASGNWFSAMFGGEEEFEGEDEIDRVARDLIDQYPDNLKRAFFVDDYVKRLNHLLYEKGNIPLVILGEEGVGKHSILEETIFQYCKANEKKNYFELQKVWHLDPTKVISGMSVVGQWQKRMESIIEYAKNRLKNEGYEKKSDILFVDRVLPLLSIGKSSQNNMTMSDLLRPYLEKRSFPFVIITSPDHWKKVQEEDRRFADLFQIFRVTEPEPNTAISMILRQRSALERETKVKIKIGALKKMLEIHHRFLSNQALPGSVVKLMKQMTKHKSYPFITSYHVHSYFAEINGLNMNMLGNETQKREDLHKSLSARLVGQPRAVDAMTDMVLQIRARLTDPSKPLGSFLFIGPTGVGKTQAAKELCRQVMKDETALLRFDMNEYFDSYAANRLIGDFFQPEGQLTGKVRYQPFGILLFDEIEKAHPKVRNLLLQVLDDGRLTDSTGRTVDFSNLVIIMTSNVGARNVESAIQVGKKHKGIDHQIYNQALRTAFPPEFINRIDEIIVFEYLKEEHIEAIANIQINQLLKRDGFVRRTTMLNIDPDVLSWITKRGYNREMGGRSLKRQIEKDLTALSAQQLVSVYSAAPIIFHIGLKDNHLHPTVHPLEYAKQNDVQTLNVYPKDEKERTAFSKIKHKALAFKDSFSSKKEGDIIQEFEFKKDSPKYLFLDNLNEIISQLNDILVAKMEGDALPKPMRVRLVRTKLKNDREYGKNEVIDQLVGKEALNELSETYSNSQNYFEKGESVYLDFWIDLFFLNLGRSGFNDNRLDKIKISFKEGSSQRDASAINFLMNTYYHFLDSFNLSIEYDRKDQFLIAEGFGLFEWLKGEAGFHMFFRELDAPLPVNVEISLLNAEEPIKASTYKILRLYDTNLTISDLRTGFSINRDISSREMKMLIWGGFEKE